MTPEEIQAEIDAITESGGPKPQFAGNEILTATNLNLATRHWVTTEVPGDHLGENGDIAFVAGGAAPNSQLPGIGGWATSEEVDGTYNVHPYNDGQMDWIAYEWIDEGFLTTTDGLVDCLVVNSGTGISTRTDLGGHGGMAQRAIYDVSSSSDNVGGGSGDTYVTTIGVGTSNTDHNRNGVWWSTFGIEDVGDINGKDNDGVLGTDLPIHGKGLDRRTKGLGKFDDILGPNDIRGYGGGGGGNFAGQAGYPIPDYDPVYGGGNPPRANSGGGYGSGESSARPPDNGLGARGCVIVRVPAANAQNVTENFYRWISYATVENGVVTKVTKTPDNQPYAASEQEVECDASVQEGYLYENGEFTAPEPDYSDEIEALTARLEELRNV